MNTPDHIRLLCLDCDGVLTDGTILLADDGTESKRFHVHDGLAIKAWLSSGRSLAVITARHSVSLTKRMAELGVGEVHQGVSDKRAVLEELLERLGIEARESAYMGDDLADLPALSCCGFSMAPANARPEVLSVAQWVSDASGGNGAVRESIEMLMRSAGEWQGFVDRFTKDNQGCL
jgi:3-deoxy-D-manno-octulosonate 8-phosphate phosphatase (KDO 8-P phosphatase)